MDLNNHILNNLHGALRVILYHSVYRINLVLKRSISSISTLISNFIKVS